MSRRHESPRTFNGPAVLCTLLVLVCSGCVRRTLTINTEPQGATVFLNDEEIGPTPVSRDFLWYGDYDVIIRKDGYETLQTHWKIKAPWYDHSPFDFFAEVLWPGEIHDEYSTSYTLRPAEPIDVDAVISRARELRDRALFENPG